MTRQQLTRSQTTRCDPYRATSFLLGNDNSGKEAKASGENGGTGTARNVAPTQRDILRDVMLAAGKYGAWMTLRELARLTRYGEASISAQLRQLRRAECGGYVLEKRVRAAEIVGSEEHVVVWEYRLSARGLKQRRISERNRVESRPRGAR
jgi:hypothetical protein